MTTDEHEYLTFLLDEEEFGVDILCVQEIMVLTPTTKIPGLPDYVRGVINLRGIIVPIVDLRARFNLPEREYDTTTVVIVLRINDSSKSVVLGVVADAVSEVYKLAPENIKNPPNFGTQVDSQFIHGLGAVDEKLLVLLDTERLMDVDALYKIAARAVPETGHASQPAASA